MASEPDEGTKAYDKLAVLAILVEAYESETYRIGPASSVETIRFHLDRLGWTQAKLTEQSGIQASHLSAVLNGRRALSLTQIKKLSALFEIPADDLIDNPFRDESQAMRA